MSSPTHLTRREMLRRGLLFSAALMAPRFLMGAERAAEAGALNLFCFGDWGSGADANQYAVAQALQEYARVQGVTPEALMLLGDNFYGKLPGVDSPRWQTEFEDMYPASVFPGPCYAVLGNHDYDDQPGGAQIQMDYARKPLTRWKMPHLWYRLDLPAKKPVATFLCVDTHFKGMTEAEIAAQQQWLEEQLAAPRTTPWMIVCGHHPVWSCGARHGDSKHLKAWKEFLPKNNVHAYLCGHEHDLQHLHEGESPTHWLVAGGGGKNLHEIGEEAGDVRFAQMKFGFLHVALTAKAMQSTFVGTEAEALYTHKRELAA